MLEKSDSKGYICFVLRLFHIYLLFSFTLFNPLIAQIVEGHMLLDQVIISADKKFDAESFIEVVIKDSTFYQAFINLKYYPHSFSGSMNVRNTDETERGTMFRKAIQTRNSLSQRVVEVLEEEISPKILNRKGEFKYLTAEMYDEIFFPKELEIVSPKINKLEQEEERGSKMDKYKSQVKKMMFNPGSAINSVPFIGDKMAIFSEEMVPFYDYRISSDLTADSVYCYVFEVTAKPEFKENKTVVKYMKSYFEKKTMNVVQREYTIRYKSAILDFDIHMDVKNDIVKNKLLPRYIRYDGQWDIPFKKPEIIKFTIDNYQWIVQ